MTVAVASPSAAVMSVAKRQREPRRAWIDNLRVAVIAGVIVDHVATAYVLDIDWYYEERTTHAATEVVVAAAILPASLFAMAVLFLVAGVLAQRSLARKGAWPFILGRLVRLGAPLVIFTLLIGPMTSVLGARAEADPAADDVGSLFVEELHEFDTGPMWFLAALLVFSIAYAAWRNGRSARGTPPLWTGHLVAAGAAIVIGSFVVRLAWPFTADSPFGLNLWEWPQMATLFALGVLAGERGWLDPLPFWVGRTCRWATVAGLAGLAAVVAAVGLGDDKEAFAGGWNVEALAAPAVEATIAVAMSLLLLAWFRRRWDHDGPLARALGRASFAAYILHAPVVVLLSAALSSLALVTEVKFVVVAMVGIATSFTLGWLATRLRPLSRVL